MVRLFVILFLSFSASCFSQRISGTVVDEENNPVPAVLVFNMTTEKKAYTILMVSLPLRPRLTKNFGFYAPDLKEVQKSLNTSIF